MKQSVFSRTALVILFAGAVGLLAVSFLLAAYERPDLRLGHPAGPGSHSIAATGHAAWYNLLEECGPHVERFTDESVNYMDSDDVLVFLEPNARELRHERREELFGPNRVLLVLPKWRGVPDKDNPGWVDNVKLADISVPNDILDLIARHGWVTRRTWPTEWRRNEFSFAPSGDVLVQLFSLSGAEPIIGTEDGILFGRVDWSGNEIYILADPDIINNHGIVRGNNADLAVDIAYHMIGEYGYIYFDEVVRGHRTRSGRSPLSLLLRFPFVVVTILAVLTMVLVVFAGFRRFGPPRQRRSGLGLEYGKELLLRNSARLLDQAGHQDAVLLRHIDLTLRQTGEALHAPPGLDRTALAEWLDRIAASRGAGSCREIVEMATPRFSTRGTTTEQLFEAVTALRAWQKRVLNGTGQHRENS